MLEKSFGVFFYLKQSKSKRKMVSCVYLRITVDGISKELSAKMIWEDSRWNSKAGRAMGVKEDAKTLNNYLDTLITKVYQAKRELIELDKPVTVEAIKNVVTGKEEDKKMILEIFQHHNEQIRELTGREYAPATLKRYQTALDHTRSFIRWKYGKEDLDIKKLNYEFISEYAFWLKSVRNCNHNTTIKYLTNLKKIVFMRVCKGWLQRDSYVDFKMSKKEVIRVALTEQELHIITQKYFPIERLNLVRDIFLFSCYIGLAYIDVKKLKRTEITTGIDGPPWITTRRQKNGNSIKNSFVAGGVKVH